MLSRAVRKTNFDYHHSKAATSRQAYVVISAVINISNAAAAAERYFGPEQGRAWIIQMSKNISGMVRIAITPEWVGLLDFQTRLPSAISP
jgi:hypothetical protein